MLINCHECGSKVSTEAAACMSCGAPPRKEIASKSSETFGSLSAEAIHFATVDLGKESPVAAEPGNITALKTEVDFQSARYNVTCPICKEESTVTGLALCASEFIKCRDQRCRGKILFSKNVPQQVNSQVIIYRWVRDLFSFDGRIAVGGYWLSLLMLFPLLFPVAILDSIVNAGGALTHILSYFMGVPLRVKRMHDLGMSGRWEYVFSAGYMILLVGFLAIGFSDLEDGQTTWILVIISVFWLIMILFGGYLALFEGQKTTNRYGPRTKDIRYQFFS